MKIIKNKSVRQSMKLTPVEKDMLKILTEEDDYTEKCIVAYYLTALANKSKLREIASEWGIKSSWANTVFDIGKKLWFMEIKKVKLIKHN